MWSCLIQNQVTFWKFMYNVSVSETIKDYKVADSGNTHIRLHDMGFHRFSGLYVMVIQLLLYTTTALLNINKIIANTHRPINPVSRRGC